MGGFVCTRIYVPENIMSGEKGDNPVSTSVSVPTVHKNCTLVRSVYHSTVALDWTRVGGVMHEGLGLCKNLISEGVWRPKYTPDWENLPGWVHPRYKPECSRRQNRIYLDGSEDTLSSHYLTEYLPKETGKHGRGRRLSGRVGEAVRRIEGREGEGVGGEEAHNEKVERDWKANLGKKE